MTIRMLSCSLYSYFFSCAIARGISFNYYSITRNNFVEKSGSLWGIKQEHILVIMEKNNFVFQSKTIDLLNWSKFALKSHNNWTIAFNRVFNPHGNGTLHKNQIANKKKYVCDAIIILIRLKVAHKITE